MSKVQEWGVVEGCTHHGFYVIDECGDTVCDLYFMGNRAVHEFGVNAKHNANLIAAAPEMYEFLKSLQLDVSGEIRRDEILAKARGGL